MTKAVETIRMLPDPSAAGQEKTPDIGHVIAHIRARGFHLVFARDLPRVGRP